MKIALNIIKDNSISYLPSAFLLTLFSIIVRKIRIIFGRFHFHSRGLWNGTNYFKSFIIKSPLGCIWKINRYIAHTFRKEKLMMIIIQNAAQLLQFQFSILVITNTDQYTDLTWPSCLGLEKGLEFIGGLNLRHFRWWEALSLTIAMIWYCVIQETFCNQ